MIAPEPAVKRPTRILVGYNGRSSSRDALALGALVAALDAHQTVERRAVAAEPPAEGLKDLARGEGADLIVIGTTHRGPIGQILPGTTADALVAKASCPFAVAPRGYADRPAPDLRLIGLAYDGSAEAMRAASVARALALLACAPIRAFGVCEPLAGSISTEALLSLEDEDLREPVERQLDELLDSLPPSIGGQKVILTGEPAHALLEQGPRAADIMVFGCHGFGRLLRLVVGSVTSEVVRSAPWPVIIVPPSGPLAFGARSSDGPIAAKAA
jgi:nucleotide-binding universal stress UspA family protein